MSQGRAGKVLLCFQLVTILFLVLMTAGPLHADEFIFHDRPNFTGTTVKSDWCGEVVDLKLTALQDPAIFDPPNSVYLQQKALGVSLVAMGIVCPAVKKITLSGWYRGELYYAGTASVDNDWRLVGLYEEPNLTNTR